MTTIARSVGLARRAPERDGAPRCVRALPAGRRRPRRGAQPRSTGWLWVLRRAAMRITHTPRFRADVHLATWCSGVGPRWAERRTDLMVGEGGVAEAVAIWVHVDPERGAPLPIPAGFDELWGATAAGRRVRATLRHPAPPADAVRVCVAAAGDRPRRPRPREQRGVLGAGRGGARAARAVADLARGDRVPRRPRRRRPGRVPRRRYRRRLRLLALCRR